MPVFYLDVSAIAKMYLPDEQGVDFVVQFLGSRLSGDVFVTSTCLLSKLSQPYLVELTAQAIKRPFWKHTTEMCRKYSI